MLISKAWRFLGRKFLGSRLRSVVANTATIVSFVCLWTWLSLLVFCWNFWSYFYYRYSCTGKVRAALNIAAFIPIHVGLWPTVYGWDTNCLAVSHSKNRKVPI